MTGCCESPDKLKPIRVHILRNYFMILPPVVNLIKNGTLVNYDSRVVI